jgi:hypothetical protein
VRLSQAALHRFIRRSAQTGGSQDRLVQWQKLASLGQLTAGIVYAIKNPLNFVNNFSSVSAELLYELRENLGKVKADAALTHTMQRLQVELIGGLRRHKLHRWTYHRLGDRLRVAEVILLPLLRQHHASIMTKCQQLAAEMTRSDTGLHPDQAPRHIGKTSLYLATRPLLSQHDRTAIIQGYDVERVLSNMMPTTAIAFCAVVAGIACSLSRTPAQLSCLRRRRHPAMSDIGPLLGVKETYADVGRLRFCGVPAVVPKPCRACGSRARCRSIAAINAALPTAMLRSYPAEGIVRHHVAHWPRPAQCLRLSGAAETHLRH